MTAPRIVRVRGQRGLHPLEIGQAVGEVPRLHTRVGRPALEIEWVAALEDLTVDAAAAPEDLAARVEDPTAVHERLGLGFVAPVVEPAADRKRERRRHVDEGVDPPVGAPGLQHENARLRVLGEAVCQHGTRRSTADDDVIELPGHVAAMLAPRRCRRPVVAHRREPS